jgi:NADPH:quinone reductase-like Zn-dependent oxidoreductase
LAGLTVITTASVKHTDYLKSLGANHVIDRHLSTEAVIAEISKILDQQLLKYSVDTVTNAETGQMVYNLLAPNVVGPDYIQNKAENKQVSLVRGWASADENAESVAVLYKHLTSTLLEEGTIRVSTTVYTYD